MKFLTLSAATLALCAMPMTANAQLFGGFDNSTLLSGAVGAGLGGAIGSNLAGSGVRDEGTAIGAVLGGLAGAAYGNSRSRYGNNPYAGSFNPGFSGNNLLGSAIGAGLGGAIGSNLAGSGQRQEGTAIGAVLGGLAGYGLSNRGRSRYGNQGFTGPAYGGPIYGGPAYGGAPLGGPIGGGFGPAGFAPAGFGPTSFAPAGFAPTGFGPAVLPALPSTPILRGPQMFPTGQWVDAGITSTVITQAPAMPAPVLRPAVLSLPVTPAPQRVIMQQPDITVAAPNVRLAGPSLHRPDIYVGTTRRETMPVIRAERIYINSPTTVNMNAPVSAPSTPTYSAPIVTAPSYTIPTRPTPSYVSSTCGSTSSGCNIGSLDTGATYSLGGMAYAPTTADLITGSTRYSDGYSSSNLGHSRSSYDVSHDHGNSYDAPGYFKPGSYYNGPTYCYGDSQKRYTTSGQEIFSAGCGH